jgi:hypothetical protein
MAANTQRMRLKHFGWMKSRKDGLIRIERSVRSRIERSEFKENSESMRNLCLARLRVSVSRGKGRIGKSEPVEIYLTETGHLSMRIYLPPSSQTCSLISWWRVTAEPEPERQRYESFTRLRNWNLERALLRDKKRRNNV